MFYIFVNVFFNCVCIFISFIFNIWILVYIKIFRSILEKKNISSETRLSSEIILYSLSTSVTLLTIFRFSEKRAEYFSKSLYCQISLMDQDFQNTTFAPSYTICYRSFFVFCTFSLILEFVFWNKSFLNMTFSWLRF